jgi:hypothetical protein
MSSRFHNKFHRHNHHTKPSTDPRYPDSAHDPIASPEAPFEGQFVVNDGVSAVSVSADAGVFSIVKAEIDFTGENNFRVFDASQPVFATGSFLLIKVNGDPYAIRLWSYPEE